LEVRFFLPKFFQFRNKLKKSVFLAGLVQLFSTIGVNIGVIP
jgi:hypothetical protein